MAILKQRLKELDQYRETKRADRVRHRIPSVAIVGYTNAGKSSILNRLTGAGVLVENALFATLDPTTRRTQTADGRGYTLTDTVGFVRHLPHDLVVAFRSTLEETREADLLVHVVDAADTDPAAQILAVRDVLAEIDAADVSELLVLNKIDTVGAERLTELRHEFPDALFCSARTNRGIDELKAAVDARLPHPTVEIRALVPYARGDLLDQIHQHGEFLTQEHTGDGTRVTALVHPDLAHQLEPFRQA